MVNLKPRRKIFHTAETTRELTEMTELVVWGVMSLCHSDSVRVNDTNTQEKARPQREKPTSNSCQPDREADNETADLAVPDKFVRLLAYPHLFALQCS